jgi:ParB-like nuclease domain
MTISRERSMTMAETETITLKTTTAKIAADSIDVPDRMRALDEEKVAELVESIGRQGLMQPIGVRDPNPPGGGRPTLIWGAHRLAAYLRTDVGRDHTGSQYIPAVCYAPDLPEPWMHILEIEENLRRKELTVQEKAEHTIRLAAELKELASQKSRYGSDFSNSSQKQSKPATGRAYKGIVQTIAEQVNVDHGTVRHRARKASEAIGETVDLDKDSPSELRRKTDKLKATPKPKRVRTPKPIGGDRVPTPKHEPKQDVRVMVNHLLSAIPKNFDAASWAAEMPAFLRKTTASSIKELRDRLLTIEAVLNGADESEETTEQRLGPPAVADGIVRAGDEAIDGMGESMERISPRTGKPVRKYTRRA